MVDVAALPPDAPGETYELTISRLTVDKLGVKLYDKASAVVAELVANGYDADAEHVRVEIPLGTELATKGPAGQPAIDKGLEILVTDDGHGMTPAEAMAFYLQVGRDRRDHHEQGATSRDKKRPVMGRKGIGKLSPFGICRRIEVLSSGGDETPNGYITAHFFLDFEDILKDTDTPVPLATGPLDRTHRAESGTTIRLTLFHSKRVPDAATFHRQLARRFSLAAPDFAIEIVDTRPSQPVTTQVEQFKVPLMPGTRVNVGSRRVTTADGEKLKVTGWLGLAAESYRNEEMAGVRIYARGKIVATTRDFEQPAGFTGEFTMRSYLVGEIHAEWLDEDEGEDLIRTDRQAILWDSERGRALRDWGASLIKEIGAASRAPRRKKKSDIFLEKSAIAQKAKDRFGDQSVVEAALDLAKRVGAFAAEDELDDPDYVESLTDILLSVAPHQALTSAFKTIAQQEDATVEDLVLLFGKTRVAELASYSQIADERVQSIERLGEAIDKPGVDEDELQGVIASAPWLIRTDWSIITDNRSLKTFRERFVKYWKERTGEDLDIAISFERKRPDFTMINAGRRLHIVEIKAPAHNFDNTDYERLENYLEAFEEFATGHPELMKSFPDGWQIDLIADGVNITNTTKRRSYQAAVDKGQVIQSNWDDFLHRARIAHEDFLEAHERALNDAS